MYRAKVNEGRKNIKELLQCHTVYLLLRFLHEAVFVVFHRRILVAHFGGLVVVHLVLDFCEEPRGSLELISIVSRVYV